ncbi:MAG: hypothetical protein ACP5JG_13300, partial [Anaerolineae bacterium]
MPFLDRIRIALETLTASPPPNGNRDALATISAHASAVQARVDDSSGWQSLTHAPGDRPWGDVYADLEDALEAWRKNFLIRRVVNLTRSYAVGSGITIGSSDPDIAAFIQDFWT